MYNVSIGRNKTDIKPSDRVVSFEDLVIMLTSFPDQIQEKGSGANLVPGHFLGRSRKKINLTERSLITYDLDYCTQHIDVLSVVLERELASYRYIAYSTSNHAPETPKLRLVLFPKKPIKTEDYNTIASNLLLDFPEIYKMNEDKSNCMKANNAMFLPIRTSPDYIPWSQHSDGLSIDTDKYMQRSDPQHQQKQVTHNIQPVPLQEIMRFLSNHPASGCNYDKWIQIGMGLHFNTNGSEEGLLSWLEWSLHDPRYENSKIKSECYNKWQSFSSDANSASMRTIMQRYNRIKVTEMMGDEVVTASPSVDNGLVPIKDWVIVEGKKRRPVACLENFLVLLAHYKIRLEYDVITKQEIFYFNNDRQIDSNSCIIEIRSLCSKNKIQINSVPDWIYFTARKNEINSFKSWILSKPWDGIDRLPEVYKSISVDDEYELLKQEYLRTWFLQLIHMTCLNDGEKGKTSRQVLVFQGEEEIGKTSWYKSLLPEQKSDLLQDGITLNLNSDTAVYGYMQHIVVELGELDATFRKADMEQLKSFISKSSDLLNIKYIPRPVKFRRRTVFMGTVNRISFLESGGTNTRFLVLPIKTCDTLEGINHQQLYAQLYEMACKTKKYWLDDNYKIKQRELNLSFKSTSPIEDKINEHYICDDENFAGRHIYNASQILESIGFEVKICKNQRNEIARVLDDMGFKRVMSPKRGWLMPELKKNVSYHVIGKSDTEKKGYYYN